MSIAPIRPLSAAEAALRGELAPEIGPIVRSTETRPIASPQGPNADQVELRSRAASVQARFEAPVEPTPAAAVRSALQTGVARQAGLGPLLADLVEAVRAAAIPLPLRAAALQFLAAQPQLPTQPTGGELRRALSRSGLFLEARLASALAREQGDPSAGRPPMSAAAAIRGDAKAHLLAFRGVVQGWLAAQPGSAPPAQLETKPPAPPYAEGPTRGQPPVVSDLPADVPAAAIAQRLMQAADGALARHELLQIASLPDAAPAAAEMRSWMFELPIATPQGPAIAHFEIARDGGRGSAGVEAQPVWRARFSLDVEPLGPVHAHVSLRPGHTNISLWAERSSIAHLLARESEGLASALRHSDMTVEVAVREGAPSARIASAGQFVDEAT